MDDCGHFRSRQPVLAWFFTLAARSGRALTSGRRSGKVLGKYALLAAAHRGFAAERAGAQTRKERDGMVSPIFEKFVIVVGGLLLLAGLAFLFNHFPIQAGFFIGAALIGAIAVGSLVFFFTRNPA